MQSSINRAWYASHVFIFFTMAIRLALVVGLAFGGYALAERKHYQACLVIAIVSCIFIPIGTALGVFTIIVLQRPTVKRMFGRT